MYPLNQPFSHSNNSIESPISSLNTLKSPNLKGIQSIFPHQNNFSFRNSDLKNRSKATEKQSRFDTKKFVVKKSPF